VTGPLVALDGPLADGLEGGDGSADRGFARLGVDRHRCGHRVTGRTQPVHRGAAASAGSEMCQLVSGRLVIESSADGLLVEVRSACGVGGRVEAHVRGV
jgi:hypothetical protein